MPENKPCHIKKAFKNYVEKVYVADKLNKVQYTEIKRAFIYGIAWFKEEMVGKVDSEEQALQFFSNIDQECTDFVLSMQTNMEEH